MSIYYLHKNYKRDEPLKNPKIVWSLYTALELFRSLNKYTLTITCIFIKEIRRDIISFHESVFILKRQLEVDIQNHVDMPAGGVEEGKFDSGDRINFNKISVDVFD